MVLKKLHYSLKNEIKILRNLIHHRLYINPKAEKNIVEQFHKLYYNAHIFGKSLGNMSWLGVSIRKCPLDLWVYQEIIFKVKPDVIIESGTSFGGSALFLASMCDLADKGRVITIDIKQKEKRPKHKRITYLLGSSTSEEIVEKLRTLIKKEEKVMVLLDSRHHRDYVLDELKIYNQFVTKGSYLIVEDSNINHPIHLHLEASPSFPGPMEAVEKFLKGNKSFVIDKDKEKFFLTFNPKGYLKRIK